MESFLRTTIFKLYPYRCGGPPSKSGVPPSKKVVSSWNIFRRVTFLPVITCRLDIFSFPTASYHSQHVHCNGGRNYESICISMEADKRASLYTPVVKGDRGKRRGAHGAVSLPISRCCYFSFSAFYIPNKTKFRCPAFLTSPMDFALLGFGYVFDARCAVLRAHMMVVMFVRGALEILT